VASPLPALQLTPAQSSQHQRDQLCAQLRSSTQSLCRLDVGAHALLNVALAASDIDPTVRLEALRTLFATSMKPDLWHSKGVVAAFVMLLANFANGGDLVRELLHLPALGALPNIGSPGLGGLASNPIGVKEAAAAVSGTAASPKPTLSLRLRFGLFSKLQSPPISGKNERAGVEGASSDVKSGAPSPSRKLSDDPAPSSLNPAQRLLSLGVPTMYASMPQILRLEKKCNAFYSQSLAKEGLAEAKDTTSGALVDSWLMYSSTGTFDDVSARAIMELGGFGYFYMAVVVSVFRASVDGYPDVAAAAHVLLSQWMVQAIEIDTQDAMENNADLSLKTRSIVDSIVASSALAEYSQPLLKRHAKFRLLDNKCVLDAYYLRRQGHLISSVRRATTLALTALDDTTLRELMKECVDVLNRLDGEIDRLPPADASTLVAAAAPVHAQKDADPIASLIDGVPNPLSFKPHFSRATIASQALSVPMKGPSSGLVLDTPLLSPLHSFFHAAVSPSMPSELSLSSFPGSQGTPASGALAGPASAPGRLSTLHLDSVVQASSEEIRTAASSTVRLNIATIASSSPSAVRAGRLAARGIKESWLIQTGASVIYNVLFHPTADMILTSDGITISAWKKSNGEFVSPIENYSENNGAIFTKETDMHHAEFPSGAFGASARELQQPKRASNPHGAPEAQASSLSWMSWSRGVLSTPLLSSYLDKKYQPGKPEGLPLVGRRPPIRAPLSTSTFQPASPPSAHGASSMGHSVLASSASVHPKPHRVTSLAWIDEQAACHLLTADDTGVIRVWDGEDLCATLRDDPIHDLDSSDELSLLSLAGSRSLSAPKRSSSMRYSFQDDVGSRVGLISSFSAFPELSSVFSASNVPHSAAQSVPGVSMLWNPMQAHLVVGGGRATYLKVFDLQQQACVSVLPVPTPSSSSLFAQDAISPSGSDAQGHYVTCISSAWPGSTSTLLVGMSFGAVHMLDLRMGGLSQKSACVATFAEHKRWVVNVVQPRSSSLHTCFSGALSGDVRTWDIRNSSQSISVLQAHRSPMTSLAVHDFAPLFATGSTKQQVRYFTSSGESVGESRYHEGFLGQRIGPVSCMAFDPHAIRLGVGGVDGTLTVLEGESNNL
jgi:hypothetical protein